MKSFASTSRAWFALPLVTAFLLGSVATAQTITSSVPGLISFQGRVTTPLGALVGAGTPVNRTVTLRIWNSPTSALAADLVYSEQQTATISEGEFSVLIGQGTNVSGEETKGPGTVALGSLGVFASATRFLGITVDDGTAALDPEISPRQQIVTSAYAFRAKFAESIGTNGTSALTVIDGGNVGVGTGNPSVKLEVSGAIAASGAVAGGGFTFRGTGDTDGGLFSPSDGVVTIRTDNTEKFRVTSGGFVGIGTASPQTMLDVNGGISATPAGGHVFGGGDVDTGMFSAGSDILTFKTANVERVRMTSAGKVGIGTGTPTYALDLINATPEFLIGKSDGTLGAIYLGGASHGLKRNYNGVGNDVGLYTTTGDLYLSANGAARTTDFVLKNGGSVAIGTATVTDKLNVGGNIRVTGVGAPALVLADAANTARGTLGVATVAANFSGDAAVSDMVLRSEGNKLLLQSGAGASAIAITSSNTVGIGTSSPEAKLDVGGNTDGAIQAILTRGADATFRLVAQNKSASNNVGAEISRFGLAYGTTIRTGFAFMRGGSGDDIAMAVLAGGSVERMRFTSGGRVGIGTTAPEAPLHVAGSAASNFFIDAYMDGNGAVNSGSNTTQSHSIIADARMRATAYDVISDARIKHVVRLSDGGEDLAKLMALRVTDYTFKDTAEQGVRPQKKVIAQQVEAVFPQAVGLSTNVVPDIFQKASLQDGWVQLATDLKVGERVRLITGEQSAVHTVLAVEATRFRTDLAAAAARVFVYGREVKDFRSVDYDAIAMLNVSATQQLKRDTDAEVKSLRAENAALRAQLAAQDGRVAAIEKMLSTTTTVMARPATSSTASGQ